MKSLDEADAAGRERRSIRLDGPCPQAGIAAALRRAFDQPAPRGEDMEEEFDRLLAKVH